MRLPSAPIGLALALALGIAGFAGLLAAHAESGPTPPQPHAQAGATATGMRKGGKRLELAGSGTNLPLTRRLAEAFALEIGAIEPRIHASIGSTGGLAAVRDGVVQLGLVSRTVREGEGAGLQVWPYARVAVVVAAHGDVPEEGLASTELVALYRGAKRTWSDRSPAVVIQREQGDSAHRAMDALLPSFAAANKEAWRARRFPVVYSDAVMAQTLVRTAGSVGLLDAGAIRIGGLPLRVLKLDGVAPTVDNLATGRYACFKDLALVSRGKPDAEAAGFVDFVFSARGQALIRSHGYLPLARGGP